MSQKVYSQFTNKVYETTRCIPKGMVSTYSVIARTIGKPQGGRAVGNVLNKNPFKSVPCHRVIRSNGFVGGYSRGIKNKIEKLKKEGVTVIRNKINLSKFLHDAKGYSP